MPRPKGSQNKVTTEFKVQLQNLIDEAIMICLISKL